MSPRRTRRGSTASSRTSATPPRRNPRLGGVRAAASDLRGALRRRNDPDGPSRPPTVAFPLLIMILVVAGCITLLAINVTVSNQAFELRARRTTAASQRLQLSDLQRQVYDKAAPGALADAAAKLGMVPNPYPNFVDLRTGAVSTGRPVTGTELTPLLTPPPTPTKTPTPSAQAPGSPSAAQAPGSPSAAPTPAPVGAPTPAQVAPTPSPNPSQPSAAIASPSAAVASPSAASPNPTSGG